MRAAMYVVRINPAINRKSESAICHHTGRNGNNALITTGDVNGIIEPQKPSELSGLLMTLIAIKMEMIIGTVIGTISDC